MSDFPESWQLSTLADVGEWKGGGTPSKAKPAYWKGEIPWVSPKDMKSDIIRFSEDSINEIAISESSASLIPAGAILVVTRSGILRHTLPLAVAGRNLAINQDLKAITVRPGIEHSYVFQYMKSNSQDILDSCMKSGTTVESIETSQLKNFPIPIPQLPEQKKIAEILSGIDKLIIKKEKQICILENLEKSVLDALTDQELRAGTRCAPLSEIVSPDRKITYGIVQAGPNIKDGIPYIRVTDMSDEELDVNKMLRTSPEIAEKFKRSEVQEGDIVVALRGIIGATHLIDDRTSGANLTQGTALLSKSDKCLPLYVNTILKSQFCREQFSLLSKGSTIVEITLSSLATLMIPLPNISTQERIANSIASIKRQISSNRKSLASIRSMKNAIASDLLSGRKRVSV
jgi:type I restriction enzyme S subunit